MSNEKLIADEHFDMLLEQLRALFSGTGLDVLNVTPSGNVVGMFLLELLRRDLGKKDIHKVSPGDVLRSIYNVDDIRQWSFSKDASQYRGW